MDTVCSVYIEVVCISQFHHGDFLFFFNKLLEVGEDEFENPYSPYTARKYTYYNKYYCNNKNN